MSVDHINPDHNGRRDANDARDDAFVPTRRLAVGYPDRIAGREVNDAAEPARMLTARHAAALFQTHIIAEALAPANDDGARAAGQVIGTPNYLVPQTAPFSAVSPAQVGTPAAQLTPPVDERTLRRRLALLCLCAGASLFCWAGYMVAREPSRTDAPSRLQSRAAQPLSPQALLPDATGDLFDASARRGVTSIDQRLAVAERLVAEGRIIEARRALAVLAAAGEPRAVFALGETFDPQMLAAWRINVSPDVAEARRLYQTAAAAGHSEATRRLDALR